MSRRMATQANVIRQLVPWGCSSLGPATGKPAQRAEPSLLRLYNEAIKIIPSSKIWGEDQSIQNAWHIISE